MKNTYVRFVVGTNREKPTRQAGVVCCLEAMRKEGRPGMILYEDEFQIIAQSRHF